MYLCSMLKVLVVVFISLLCTFGWLAELWNFHMPSPDTDMVLLSDYLIDMVTRKLFILERDRNNLMNILVSVFTVRNYYWAIRLINVLVSHYMFKLASYVIHPIYVYSGRTYNATRASQSTTYKRWDGKGSKVSNPARAII